MFLGETTKPRPTTNEIYRRQQGMTFDIHRDVKMSSFLETWDILRIPWVCLNRRNMAKPMVTPNPHFMYLTHQASTKVLGDAAGFSDEAVATWISGHMRWPMARIQHRLAK